MAWTQSDIDTLKAAIARGVTRVKVAGEEVEYRSLAEMRKTLAMMEAEVAGDTGAINSFYPTLGRGLA